MLQGKEASEVIALIKARIAFPGAQPERKLALVVEGGAMRGVYTGGALVGLHLLNATQVFDVVYGTSSGAVNAAHFLSGLGHLKAATYYRALVDGRFFNPWRLHRAVDVDFFVDQVLRKMIPLELDRVLTARTPLMIALLNCTEGRGEVIALPDHLPDAWKVIKASVAMPVLYNQTISINGKRYADGGLAIPFPLLAAIEDGSTDLLVLRSRDPRVTVRQNPPIFRILYSWMFAHGNKELINAYDTWPDTLTRLGKMAAGDLEVKPGLRIATLSPDAEDVKSGTMDAALLRRACHQMAREMLKLFEADEKEFDALVAQNIV